MAFELKLKALQFPGFPGKVGVAVNGKLKMVPFNHHDIDHLDPTILHIPFSS